MGTKTNPGAFNCYAAALPDEEVFSVLARDPALPATVHFWMGERARLGKNQTPDDLERLGEAAQVADNAKEWREKNLDPMGDGVPSWKLPRPANLDDGPRICFDPTAKTPDDLLLLPESDQRWVEETLGLSYAPDSLMTQHMLAAIERGRRQAQYENTDFIGYNEDVPAPEIKEVLHVDKMDVPYTSAEGKMTDWGIVAWIYDRLVHVHKENPLYDYMHRLAQTRDRLRDEQIGEHVKLPTVDSRPDDLAHAPEVPHHRFSSFFTAGDYAYARGLEVNPIHLPTALDAMAKSGWGLLAIFGQTDSKHIGFIFERVISFDKMDKANWRPGPIYAAGCDDLPEIEVGQRFLASLDPMTRVTVMLIVLESKGEDCRRFAESVLSAEGVQWKNRRLSGRIEQLGRVAAMLEQQYRDDATCQGMGRGLEP